MNRYLFNLYKKYQFKKILNFLLLKIFLKLKSSLKLKNQMNRFKKRKEVNI